MEQENRGEGTIEIVAVSMPITGAIVRIGEWMGTNLPKGKKAWINRIEHLGSGHIEIYAIPEDDIQEYQVAAFINCPVVLEYGYKYNNIKSRH